MFKLSQFRELIVQSTLKDLNLYSPDAEELLVFTCATESLGGTYLTQVNGPALGIYQMEPETYNDIWQNYLKNQTSLCLKLFSNLGITFQAPVEQLIYDLRYATAMARVYYLRVSEPLPKPNDQDAIYDYYKRHYNTALGVADKQSSILKYINFLRN